MVRLRGHRLVLLLAILSALVLPLASAAGETQPPLEQAPMVEFMDGPVMPNAAMYAVYLQPSNASLSFPPGYKQLVNQYLADLASSGPDDVSIANAIQQYGGSNGRIRPGSFAGSITDTRPLNLNGCTFGPGFCLSGIDLVREVKRLIEARNLPTGLNAGYVVLLPEGLGSCITSYTCLGQGACAYHSLAPAPSGLMREAIIYATIPYFGPTCDSGEQPNGNPADKAIYSLSHEWAEMHADPIPFSTWAHPPESIFAAPMEVADICSWNPGEPIGETPTGSYNQLINGRPYYSERIWSNQDRSCVNNSPVLKFPKLKVTASRYVLKVGQPVHLKASLPEPAHYRWWIANGKRLGNSPSITWRPSSAGKQQIRVVARRSNHNIVSRTITIHVKAR